MATEHTLRFAIRVATQDDLPACLALDHSSTSDFVWQVEAQEAEGRIVYSFRTVRLPRPIAIACPQELEALLASWQQRDPLLVAEGEGIIYGYLAMRLDQARQTGWIGSLVVDRPWRRQRVGSALLLQARKLAQTNGLRRLTVETQTKNFPAISFCQRHGLVFCGFNDRYYPNQDIALFFSQSIR